MYLLAFLDAEQVWLREHHWRHSYAVQVKTPHLNTSRTFPGNKYFVNTMIAKLMYLNVSFIAGADNAFLITHGAANVCVILQMF